MCYDVASLLACKEGELLELSSTSLTNILLGCVTIIGLVIVLLLYQNNQKP